MEAAAVAPPALHAYGRKFTMTSDIQLAEAVMKLGAEDFSKTAEDESLPQYKNAKETARLHRDRFASLKKLYERNKGRPVEANYAELVQYLRERPSTAASMGKVEPSWNVKKSPACLARKRRRSITGIETEEEADAFAGAMADADDASSSSIAVPTAVTTAADDAAAPITIARDEETSSATPSRVPSGGGSSNSSSSSALQPRPEATTLPSALAMVRTTRLERIRLALQSPLLRDFEVMPLAAAVLRIGAVIAGETPRVEHAELIAAGKLILRITDEQQPLPFEYTNVLSMLMASPVRDLVPDYAADLAYDTQRLIRLLADLRNPLLALPLVIPPASAAATTTQPRELLQVRFDWANRKLGGEWTALIYLVNNSDKRCAPLLKLQSQHGAQQSEGGAAQQPQHPPSIAFEVCAPEACVKLINDSTRQVVKQRTGSMPMPSSLTILTLDVDCCVLLS